MSRAVLAKIRIVIPAGAAKPAPPVGPALGQHGLNIMAFCKEFNASTSDFLEDVPVPVVLTAFKDKSLEWQMKSPPVSYFVKKAAGVRKGEARPGQGTGGTISLRHVFEIAKVKQKDEGALIGMEALCQSIISSAKSSGISVVR